MLRSTRHFVVVSSLILALIAPAAIASPVQGLDLDFGIRAHIEALFDTLGNIFEGWAPQADQQQERAYEITLDESVPYIPISGITSTDPNGDEEEEDQLNDIPDPTTMSVPYIPISG